jgi:hypothetical protein
MEQETKKKLGIDKLHLPIIDPDISLDDFYKYFDPIVDENGNPIEIKDHQREVWNHQYEYVRRAYPKSQKIYFSTTFILEDIKHALTDAMGYEIIICAQSDDHAKTHLSDFKKYILTSEFKDYLITSPIREIGLERNEITKADRAYLHNPKRPFWPTRVYALGFTEGKLVSYKRVKHVHASDITKADSKPENQDKAFASLTSRLANTQGSFVLEAPPRGQHGPLFKQHEKFNSMTEKGIDLSTMPFQEQQKYPFFVKPYDYTVGIKYGCFTPETIEGEKLIHGILFDMYYGAKFMDSDVSFYTSDMFKTSDIVTEFFGDAMSEEQ